ncbi:hypothetical protein WN51_02338 [Melipona quadrifasciata]|uniref:Uncharacterized protein n=1 Tax=Melipona quadrifasciata TaxID=166423 RepID=A0A0N0BED8_9HYME|nr:hypothetical protein WN51_02338 [Melipona quadrifasciata]
MWLIHVNIAVLSYNVAMVYTGVTFTIRVTRKEDKKRGNDKLEEIWSRENRVHSNK